MYPSMARRSTERLLRCAVANGSTRWYAAAAVPQGTGTGTFTSSSSSNHLIKLEHQYSAHNYHPIPVVFSRAQGSTIWDPEGNKYLDFLSAYSAVNQGHCHPRVIKALIDQAERLTLSSRAFHNDKFPVFAEYLTSIFGYDMVLPMNTGAEGVETALKIARKWGYEKKNIPKDEVKTCFLNTVRFMLHFLEDISRSFYFSKYYDSLVKAPLLTIFLS